MSRPRISRRSGWRRGCPSRSGIRRPRRRLPPSRSWNHRTRTRSRSRMRAGRSFRSRRASQGAGSNYKNSAAEAVTGTVAAEPGAEPGAELVVRDREGLGRSRGGLSTKIHLVADSRCRPLARGITAGQRHDSVAFERLMGQLRIRRLGRGRPRTRPGRLLADKAYSNRGIRAHLRRRRIKATIPEKSDQLKARVKKGSRGGRPPVFNTEAYKDRNTVERANNKLKGFRAVAMRTDKREFVFRGTRVADNCLHTHGGLRRRKYCCLGGDACRHRSDCRGRSRGDVAQAGPAASGRVIRSCCKRTRPRTELILGRGRSLSRSDAGGRLDALCLR